MTWWPCLGSEHRLESLPSAVQADPRRYGRDVEHGGNLVRLEVLPRPEAQDLDVGRCETRERLVHGCMCADPVDYCAALVRGDGVRGHSESILKCAAPAVGSQGVQNLPRRHPIEPRQSVLWDLLPLSPGHDEYFSDDIVGFSGNATRRICPDDCVMPTEEVLEPLLVTVPG